MGRPRNPDADAAIVEAADEILFSQGYDALSIDAVAVHAGVAKTTVYRRFATVEHLVAALLASWQREVPLPTEGDLRTRIIELVTPLARNLDPAPMRRVAAELAAAAARDADLRASVTELWRVRRVAATDTLRATLLPDAGVDLELLLDLLIGPLYYRVLVTADPLDDAYVAALVDTVLAALDLPGVSS